MGVTIGSENVAQAHRRVVKTGLFVTRLARGAIERDI